MRRALAITAVFVCALAAGNEVVPLTPPPTAGAGVASRPITLERRNDAGTPISGTSLTVIVSSSSPTGQFAINQTSGSGWSVSGNLILPFASGDTQRSFSYRDPTPGAHTLSFSGTGLVTTTQDVSVERLIIHDDFEGSVFASQTPTGQWHAFDTRTGNSFGKDGGAAHRGTFGFRAVDGVSDTTIGAEARIILNVGAVGPDAFLRGWLKTTGSQPNAEPALFIVSNNEGRPVMEVLLDPAGTLEFATRTGDGGRILLSTDAGVTPGQWTLIEGRVSGLGTTDGGIRYYVNARTVAALDRIDQTGRALGSSSIGVAWDEPSLWTGTVDWDDVALSKDLVPNFVETSLIPPFIVGNCGPVDVNARWLNLGAASFPLAAAAYDMDVSVATDAGTTHLSGNCLSAPVTTVRIAKGTTTTRAYFLPAGDGQFSYRTWHDDTLNGQAAPATANFVVVRPDAGTGDGGSGDGGAGDGGALVRQRYDVGCGCAHADSMILSAALWLLMLTRRGIRRTAA